jgi:hypothetical protein
MSTALDQMKGGASESQQERKLRSNGGITKVSSTQVDAILKQDAEVTRKKLEAYLPVRDQFIQDALGMETLEAEDVDAPFDYSGLFS